ncbi:MAG: RluA family pseudouridine synthase [Aureliella sp.]
MSAQTPRHRNEATVYHLDDQYDGLTLAAALKELIPDASWGQVKKKIAGRFIQVNGNLCLDEARRLTAKDVIKLYSSALAKPIEGRDLRLAHFDDHLLVVEKPAGVTSVRNFQERKLSTRRRQVQPTLDELLPPLLAKIQNLRWPPLPPQGMNRGRHATNRHRGRNRPGHIQNAKKLPPELTVYPVHRLDRDTSGLMLFARTKIAEQKLIGMFRRHTIGREYTAYCKGTIEPQEIRSMLVRDRGDGIRGTMPADAVPEQTDDQPPALEAITHIVKSQPIADGQYSKLRCRLETGRTHQIRIHLAEAGHPICGDQIYHKLADGSVIEDASEAPRQALHSHSLEFTHPITGEHHQFRMPLPKELKNWLDRLES